MGKRDLVQWFGNNATIYRILSDYKNEEFVIRRRKAERLLEYYRHVLSGFDMRHHVVVVKNDPRGARLLVNGVGLQAQYIRMLARGAFPVLNALRSIEVHINGNCIGEFLNGAFLT